MTFYSWTMQAQNKRNLGQYIEEKITVMHIVAMTAEWSGQ